MVYRLVDSATEREVTLVKAAVETVETLMFAKGVVTHDEECAANGIDAVGHAVSAELAAELGRLVKPLTRP